MCGMKSAYVERMCVNFVVTVCATWGDGVCVYERERERWCEVLMLRSFLPSFVCRVNVNAPPKKMCMYVCMYVCMYIQGCVTSCQDSHWVLPLSLCTLLLNSLPEQPSLLPQMATTTISISTAALSSLFMFTHDRLKAGNSASERQRQRD